MPEVASLLIVILGVLADHSLPVSRARLGGSDTTDVYRYATLNGVAVALATASDGLGNKNGTA